MEGLVLLCCSERLEEDFVSVHAIGPSPAFEELKTAVRSLSVRAGRRTKAQVRVSSGTSSKESSPSWFASNLLKNACQKWGDEDRGQ